MSIIVITPPPKQDDPKTPGQGPAGPEDGPGTGPTAPPPPPPSGG